MLCTGASVASSSPLFVVNICPYSSLRQGIEQSVAGAFRCGVAGLSAMPMLVLVLLYISSLHTARISEVLNLSAADCISPGRFLARGLKRSRSFVVFLDVLQLRPVRADDPAYRLGIFDLHYDYVWRWCKRCGIGATPRGRRTAARTHLHRYYTAKAVVSASSELTAGEILHHRSRRSISSYIV